MTFYEETESDFNKAYESLLQSYCGKESILDNIQAMAGNIDHFAYYIFKNSEETCGKVNNDLAQ